MTRRSRRSFLRNTAGAALALPFLPSLTRAQPSAAPQRIVFVYAQHQESQNFLPTGSGSSFSLAGTYLEALTPYRDRMTVVHGMQGTSGHSAGHSELLTGFPWGYDNGDGTDHWAPKGGPSLDQYLASRFGGDTPLRTLGLTISDQGLGREDHETSWRRLPTAAEAGLSVLPSAAGDVVAVPHVRSPSQAYTTLFGSGAPAPEIDRSVLLRRSLLDALVGDFGRVQARLDAADRQVLDAHLSLLRDYETRLGSAAPFSCDAGYGAPPSSVSRQASAPLHMDAIVSAFRCDATRVATFTFAPSQDEHTYPWLGVDNFHQIAHNNGDYSSDCVADHAKVRAWQIDQLKYLLDSLAAVPEGDGTLLDHTTVVWLCELGLWRFSGDGADHLRTSTPAMILGNAGGGLRMGQLVNAAGAHYHRLLLTLLHGFGFEDVARWGTSGTSPLADLQA